MNRRGFLKALGLTAAAVAILPEILEEPSSRTIFLPPRGGWWVGVDPGSGDFTTVALRFKSTERFSINTADWRTIYGSHYEEDHVDGVALRSIAHPGSENVTEKDKYLARAEGWKCVNGHPYCNRCPSPVELNEASLERLMIDIRSNTRWYIKT